MIEVPCTFFKSLAAASFGHPLFAVVALDLCHSKEVIGIPYALALRLRNAVLGLGFPGGDGLRAAPVRYGNAKPLGVACALDAKKSRLLCRQLHHALGHLAITAIFGATLRREDHRVIRWFGSFGKYGRHTDTLLLSQNFNSRVP